MSGGSYNYLCLVDSSEIANRIHDLESMQGRLARLNPDGYAATDTQEIFAILGALDFAIKRLYDVWHAVEWRDSLDWSDEQMFEVLAAYEKQRKMEESEEPVKPKDVRIVEGVVRLLIDLDVVQPELSVKKGKELYEFDLESLVKAIVRPTDREEYPQVGLSDGFGGTDL